jgi:hypothetical protein
MSTTMASDSCISLIRESPRTAGTWESQEMPGFWMRTLRVEFGTKRIPACLPSREILFREWDGSDGGCVLSLDLEQQPPRKFRDRQASRSSRPETLPSSIWRCISDETWGKVATEALERKLLLEITVEAAFQIPDQRLASSLAPELESWGALMSVSRPCPATPLHSRALPTAADEGRVPERREPEHVRNGASSRIMYPFLLGGTGGLGRVDGRFPGDGWVRNGTGGVCCAIAKRGMPFGCTNKSLFLSILLCSYLA